MVDNLLRYDEDIKDETEESRVSSSEEDLFGVFYIGDVDESSSSTHLPEFFAGNNANQTVFAADLSREDDCAENSGKNEKNGSNRDPRSSDSSFFEVSESKEDLSFPEELEQITIQETKTKDLPEFHVQRGQTESGDGDSCDVVHPTAKAPTLLQSKPNTSNSTGQVESVMTEDLDDNVKPLENYPPTLADCDEFSRDNSTMESNPLEQVPASAFASSSLDSGIVSLTTKCETITKVQEVDPLVPTPLSDEEMSTIVSTETTSVAREHETLPLPKVEREFSAISLSGNCSESQELDHSNTATYSADQQAFEESTHPRMHLLDEKTSRTVDNKQETDITDWTSVVATVSSAEVDAAKNANATREQVGCEEKDCARLLSELSEEVGLALDMILNDEEEKNASHYDGIVLESPKKLDTPLIDSSEEVEVVTTPKSSSQPKAHATRSNPKMKKSPTQTTQSSGFKARPLPKYLSKGPPQLKTRTFKPTVQVPFRLRTEERFLSRSNCACCVEKRNKILLSTSRHHEASPTDVTTQSLEPKRLESEMSPVRPTKLDELFHEV